MAAAPSWKGRAPASEKPLGAGPAAAMLYLEDYLESEWLRAGGERPGAGGRKKRGAGRRGAANGEAAAPPLPHGGGSLPA